MRLAPLTLLALLLGAPLPALAVEPAVEDSPGHGDGEEEEPAGEHPDEPDQVETLEERILRLEALVEVLQAQVDAAAAPAPEAPVALDEPAPPDSTVLPPELSAEDLAAIEAALAADAAATSSPGTAAGSSPPTGLLSTSPTLSAAQPPGSFSVGGIQLDIAFITDVALAWFSDESRQTGAHDPQVNGFNLQQLELSIGASVDPFFRIDGNIVFAQFGVEIEEIYATTLALPAGLQLRAGQFLTRFGRINPTHPHSWDFVDQPFAIGRVFGGEGNRGLGAELSILLPLPWSVELLASATMANGGATARSFFGGNDLGVRTPGDFQLTAAAKQFFPFGPDLGLSWGLSYATGPNGSGRSNRSEVVGTDLYLRWRPVSRGGVALVSLTGELLYRRRQIPGDVLWDLSGYAQLLWRFSLRWGVAGRYEWGTPARGQGGVTGTDPLDPDWVDLRQRISANVTFWPSHFSRVRLQGGVDLSAWLERPTWSVMLATEFVIGAHGAHHY